MAAPKELEFSSSTYRFSWWSSVPMSDRTLSQSQRKLENITKPYTPYFPLAAPPPQKAPSKAETPAFWSCLTQESKKETMLNAALFTQWFVIYFLPVWQSLMTKFSHKNCRDTFLFKWAQHNNVSPKMYCMLLHKLCNMPRRYVYCSLESNTKCMLCSKLLVAHVPHPNNLVYFHLLIYFTYGSDFWILLVYISKELNLQRPS